MPDGNHCSRPHPALVHDQMIKFERIARVNQGPDPGRIWDPDSDLYYGVLELEESKRVAGAGRPMLRTLQANALELTARLGARLPFAKHLFPMRTTFRHCLLVNYSMDW